MTIARQCELLSLPRSTYYYQPKPESEEDLGLLRQIDQLYMDHPFLGSRRLAALLGVNRKRMRTGDPGRHQLREVRLGR